MATLRTALGDGPMRDEHERILRSLLERRDAAPERRPGEELQGEYEPRAVEIAILNWRQRMFHEHRSAQTFANLLPQLIEAESTLEYKTVVLRSSIDELRHAALCAQVVELLGGDSAAEGDLTPEAPTVHAGVSPREQALRNLLFVGCVSETVAVAMLTEERDMTTEPFVRRALTQLLADETLHARVGWAYLREEFPRLDADARARTTAYAVRALGYYEQCIVASTLPGTFSEAVLRDARRLGFSEPNNARAIAEQAIDEVVVPQLEEVGLPVGEAWRARLCGA